jgi:hypothetical protein
MKALCRTGEFPEFPGLISSCKRLPWTPNFSADAIREVNLVIPRSNATRNLNYLRRHWRSRFPLTRTSRLASLDGFAGGSQAKERSIALQGNTVTQARRMRHETPAAPSLGMTVSGYFS